MSQRIGKCQKWNFIQSSLFGVRLIDFPIKASNANRNIKNGNRLFPYFIALQI